jgi:hypothetical protein
MTTALRGPRSRADCRGQRRGTRRAHRVEIAVLVKSVGTLRFAHPTRAFRGLLSVYSRCGLHTRAVTKFVTAIRELQTFRHLHACPGCFRLERSPGGACTRWKKRRLVTAHVEKRLSQSTWPVMPQPKRTFKVGFSCRCASQFPSPKVQGRVGRPFAQP